MRTAVVIPARNEAAGLPSALQSLADQAIQPDVVVVVANNCTDDTERLAWEAALRPGMPCIDVVSMPVNPWKKAGALNAGLARLSQLTRRRLEDAFDYVLIMDGDTRLHRQFIARAARVLASDDDLGGVSATCLGRHIETSSLWQRWLYGMQRIEYGRYSALRIRRNVHTMSGAGSFYRAQALQDIIDGRGLAFVQDATCLVEDYETTLAMKEHGWLVTANQHCIAWTDLMPTLPALVAQRQRWVRGTVDVLRQRGWTSHTRQSIVVLLLGLVGYLFAATWMSDSAAAIAEHGGRVELQYFWLIGFWAVYQIISVRHLGWRSMLIEALLIPEFAFGFLRMYWLVTAIVKSYTTTTADWAQ